MKRITLLFNSSNLACIIAWERKKGRKKEKKPHTHTHAYLSQLPHLITYVIDQQYNMTVDGYISDAIQRPVQFQLQIAKQLYLNTILSD